jgi:hypothetical protein
MLTVDEIEQIRRAYYCAQQSVRAIAREQHHHRRVVREAIAGTAAPPRQYRLRGPRPRPMVDTVRVLIDAWLEADQAAPPKQRHTAKRVFDRLVAEEGYGGKERAIREYVHEGSNPSLSATLPNVKAKKRQRQDDDRGDAGTAMCGYLESLPAEYPLRAPEVYKPVSSVWHLAPSQHAHPDRRCWVLRLQARAERGRTQRDRIASRSPVRFRIRKHAAAPSSTHEQAATDLSGIRLILSPRICESQSGVVWRVSDAVRLQLAGGLMHGERAVFGGSE